MAQGRAARTAVVLAAGGGKRLKSQLPKVLHRVAGKALVNHVLDALAPLEIDQSVIVVSSRPELREALAPTGAKLVEQNPPRGTGDALKVALDVVEARDGHVLVVPGDTPLITSDTLEMLWAEHLDSAAGATMLTAKLADPTGYGRVVRDEEGNVARIVEHRDASPEELAIDEINGGFYIFELHGLQELLAKIDSENSQAEYYLTDVIALLQSSGRAVRAVVVDEAEMAGVNSRAQLAEAGKLLFQRTTKRWMDEGVTIVDPAVTYIDSTVEIEADATIHPFTFLEGQTKVAAGAEIGPQARIVDSSI